MTTLLAISPHLDDAVFSAGGLLWTAARRGARVIVATVFTGNVARPTGFALECQLDKGLPAEIDYMALRRSEDRRACAVLGAEPVHLPNLEAPHRGYDSPAALFGAVEDDDPAEAEVRRSLTALLTELRPDFVLAPLAIGDHVDHVIVRRVAETVADPARLRLWEDWPYADRRAAPATAAPRRFPLGPRARAAKYLACTSYRSQLGFQFGGAGALAARLRAQKEERFSPGSCASDATRGANPGRLPPFIQSTLLQAHQR